MSDDKDYVLVIRGYGRILLWLGVLTMIVGVFTATAGWGWDIQRGYAWIAAGGFCLLGGAHLLRGAR